MDWRDLLSATLDNPIVRILRGGPSHPFSLSDDGLNQLALELAKTGAAAEIYDRSGYLRWVSDEVMQMLGERDPDALGVGCHYLEVVARPVWRSAVTEESFWAAIERGAPRFCAEVPAEYWSEDEAARIRDFMSVDVDGGYWATPLDLIQDDLPPIRVWCHQFELPTGILRFYGPGLRASVLALVARGDEDMFEQMVSLFEPAAHRCAIVFLDLERSTQLGRQLPSEAYFALLATLAHAIDEALIAERGIVGKHVGDGAVGFVLGDDDPADACARAIAAARRAQAAVAELNNRMSGDLGVELGLQLNGAIHFAPNLYMGQVVTGGRLEVTALGDEVNECARMIEAARGGTLLASKAVCETLADRAGDVAIDPSTTVYRQLSDYPLSDKAKADAGHLPVAPVE